MLGTGGRQTKPDRKSNRLCLCPAPVAPPHILISFYLCPREEVTVGRPWVKGGLNVNSDTERLSSFLGVTQLIGAGLSLHRKSLRSGTAQDVKGW